MWSGARREEKVLYRLFAVVNHMQRRVDGGTVGHYAAYTLNQHEWRCFNDSQVMVIGAADVCTENAYYMLYERLE